MLHEHRAELLHQWIAGSARVFCVREHRHAVNSDEQVVVVDGLGFFGDMRHALLNSGLDALLELAQVDGLAQCDQESGGHELQDGDGLGGHPGGDEAERVDALVVLLRCLHMVCHRVGKELELRAVGRHGDLSAIETVVQAR
uniref:Uncharacterized protein n=1 Tax=Zea mays TaxID=4577 RepID=A0A804M0Z3_MAIZE